MLQHGGRGFREVLWRTLAWLEFVVELGTNETPVDGGEHILVRLLIGIIARQFDKPVAFGGIEHVRRNFVRLDVDLASTSPGWQLPGRGQRGPIDRRRRCPTGDRIGLVGKGNLAVRQLSRLGEAEGSDRIESIRRALRVGHLIDDGDIWRGRLRGRDDRCADGRQRHVAGEHELVAVAPGIEHIGLGRRYGCDRIVDQTDAVGVVRGVDGIAIALGAEGGARERCVAAGDGHRRLVQNRSGGDRGGGAGGEIAFHPIRHDEISNGPDDQQQKKTGPPDMTLRHGMVLRRQQDPQRLQPDGSEKISSGHRNMIVAKDVCWIKQTQGSQVELHARGRGK